MCAEVPSRGGPRVPEGARAVSRPGALGRPRTVPRPVAICVRRERDRATDALARPHARRRWSDADVGRPGGAGSVGSFTD